MGDYTPKEIVALALFPLTMLLTIAAFAYFIWSAIG